MGIYDNWTYTDLHQLNLDWLIKQLQTVKTKTDAIDQAVEITENNANSSAESALTASNALENVQMLSEQVENNAESTEQYYEMTKVLTGSPLMASTAAGMTDTEKVYVYTGSEAGYNNGHWYYYDNGAWNDGGVYNAVAINLDNSLTVHNAAPDSWAVGNHFNMIINNAHIDPVNLYTISLSSNSYWNSETTTAVLTTLTGQYKASNVLSVTPGDILYIAIDKIGSSNRQNAILFTDNSNTIIQAIGRAGGGIDTLSGLFMVPYGATQLLITAWGASPTVIVGYPKITYPETGLFAGKTLSVLGDSISANITDIPAGNTAYYNNSNAGVSSASQMWYNIANNSTGMTNNIINGWSGSLVTSGVRPASIVPASDPTRCQNLSNGTTPDVIIVAMGVNDYSYDAPIGNWDGVSALNDVTTDFEHAYAVMLDRIMTAYSNATIFCMTPFFNKRGTDTGTTYVNNLGYTVNDYANSIRKIAALMSCQVIDINAIGFNRYNYNPTYSNDGTHPNSAGQNVIGESVYRALLKANIL